MALRVRNRMWAWLVLRLTPGVHTWDALDEHWLPEIDHETPTGQHCPDDRGRRRIFETCHRFGDDPSGLRGLNGTFLVCAVHAAPEMQAAKELFESEIWEVLGTAQPLPDQIQSALIKLRSRLGAAVFGQVARIASCVVKGNLRSAKRTTVFFQHVGTLNVLLMLGGSLVCDGNGDLELKERHEQAVWFSLRCLLDRWFDDRSSAAMRYLIATRFMDGGQSCSTEDELALFGFPIRRRDLPKQMSFPAAPGIKEAMNGVYEQARLAMRMQSGFASACARLAAATDRRARLQELGLFSRAIFGHRASRSTDVSVWLSGNSAQAGAALAWSWLLLKRTHSSDRHRARCVPAMARMPWSAILTTCAKRLPSVTTQLTMK